MRNFKKKIVPFIALSIMLLISITGYAANDTGLVEREGFGYATDGGQVGQYNIDGQIAFCVEHSVLHPDTGDVATILYTDYDNDLLRKILYYGYGGPEDTGEFTQVETTLLASHAYTNGADTTEEAITLVDAFEAMDSPPEYFKVVIWYTGSETQTLASWTYEPKGTVSIVKSSSNPELTEGNENYTLEGASYGIYTEKAAINQVGVFTTKSDGTSNEIELDIGTYYMKELTAPDGYVLDTNVYAIEIENEEHMLLELVDTPKYNPITLLLKKIDSELEESVAQGGGSLEGAEFRVGFYPVILEDETANPEELGYVSTRTWDFVTDENGEIYFSLEWLLSGDEFYFDTNGNVSLPIGTITIQETKAPEGYLTSDEILVQQITDDGEADEKLNCYNPPIVAEQVIRGDLELIKVADGNMKRLSGIMFQITSVDTGETHVIVTDENGYASTASNWNLHSENTNVGGSKTDGIWFGEIEALDDTLGALPYGVYIIEELSSEANINMELIEPFEISITRNDYVVNLGTLTNDYLEQEELSPSLVTYATDQISGNQVGIAGDENTIIDVIKYEDIPVGTYTLQGILMDKSTGEPLLINDDVVVASKEVEITETTGEIFIEFVFDGSTFTSDVEIVVFEELVGIDGEIVAEHKDLEAVEQTVTYIQEEPEEPEESEEEAVESSQPKTGDDTRGIFYGTLLSLSLVGIVFLMKRRKRVNYFTKK